MIVPLIMIIILILIVIILNIRLRKVERFLKIEGLTTNEAVQDIASVYANKDGTMVVNNLQVKGNLDVDGKITATNGNIGNLDIKNKITATSGKIGLWEIRKDRIGIPTRGDINLDTDKWARLINYDTKNLLDYAGTGGKGGFAGRNLSATTGKIGKWEIREDRIGIPKWADMQLSKDKWVRVVEYDSKNPEDSRQYASYAKYKGGGFGGKYLYSKGEQVI